MEEVVKIIAGACLKHSDSGEVSFNREARVILQALEESGYKVVKDPSETLKEIKLKRQLLIGRLAEEIGAEKALKIAEEIRDLEIKIKL